MNQHIGSSFSSFLDELGIRSEVDAQTARAVIKDILARTMKNKAFVDGDWDRLIDMLMIVAREWIRTAVSK